MKFKIISSMIVTLLISGCMLDSVNDPLEEDVLDNEEISKINVKPSEKIDHCRSTYKKQYMSDGFSFIVEVPVFCKHDYLRDPEDVYHDSYHDDVMNKYTTKHNEITSF